MFSTTYPTYDGHHQQKPSGDPHSSTSSGAFSTDFNGSFLDGPPGNGGASSHQWPSHRTPFSVFETSAHLKLDPDQVQIHPPLSQSQSGSSQLPLPPIPSDGNWNYLSPPNNDASYSRFNNPNGNGTNQHSNPAASSSSTDSLNQRNSEPQIFKRYNSDGSQTFGNIPSSGNVAYFGDIRLNSSHSTASSVSSASSFSDLAGANFSQGEFESPFVHHHPDDIAGGGNSGVMYSEPMSLSAEPLSLHSNASQTHLGHYSDPEQQQPHFSSQGFQHHHQSSHSSNSYPPLHGSAAEFGGSADHLPLTHSQTSSPIVVPSQTAPLPVYPSRPSSSSSGAGVGGPGAIGGIQIMHTDDASSKETQFLRRRCHNCHTTEPPSWRRSTLNEGKIVCNKCGLYERTHMRPRPPRFDEVRTTNSKPRKGSKGSSIGGVNGVGSAARLKKDRGLSTSSLPGTTAARIGADSRRGSMSSNASGNSDWDDTSVAFQAQHSTTSLSTTNGFGSGANVEFPFSAYGPHNGLNQSQQFPPTGSHFGTGSGYGNSFGGSGVHPHPLHSSSLDSASPIRLPRTPAIPSSFSNGSSLGAESARIRRKSATSPGPMSLHSPSPSIMSNMGAYGSYPSTPDLSAGIGNMGLGANGVPAAVGSDYIVADGRKSSASNASSSSSSPFMGAGILQQQQVTPPAASTTPQRQQQAEGGDRSAQFNGSSQWRQYMEPFSGSQNGQSQGSAANTPGSSGGSVSSGAGSSPPSVPAGPTGNQAPVVAAPVPIQAQATAQVQGLAQGLGIESN